MCMIFSLLKQFLEGEEGISMSFLNFFGFKNFLIFFLLRISCSFFKLKV